MPKNKQGNYYTHQEPKMHNFNFLNITPFYNLYDIAKIEKPDKILISVVAPLYNRGPILESSLRSYLFQQKKHFPENNFEIILIDDASTDNTKEVAHNIIKKYPNYNIRFYFLNETRTYNNVFPSNVGYKKSLGEIIMNTHMDVIISSYVFEAMWRQLTKYPYLWVNPRHYGQNPHSKEFELLVSKDRFDDLTEYAKRWAHLWHPPGYPSEFGGCIRKEHLMKIGGNDERIIRAPGDVNQWARLHRIGIVFGEDPSVHSIHRYFGRTRPPPFEYRKRMKSIKFDVNDYIVNKNKDWGKMTDDEEGSLLATESMRSIL